MSAISPAPWEVTSNGGAMTIVARDRSVVAIVLGSGAASPFESSNAALMAAGPDLRDAARLALMFHTSGPWDMDRAAEWKRLTGHDNGTTKALCDFIRAALAKAEASR